MFKFVPGSYYWY